MALRVKKTKQNDPPMTFKDLQNGQIAEIIYSPDKTHIGSIVIRLKYKDLDYVIAVGETALGVAPCFWETVIPDKIHIRLVEPGEILEVVKP